MDGDASQPHRPDRWARQRSEMVDRQLRDRGIRDERVLDVMRRLPREAFVPDEVRASAYADEALPIGAGQTISQPYMAARMSELLEPAPGKRILEIGTGSGYQAAILASLGCLVFSVERKPELARAACDRLMAYGLAGNVEVEIGDGSAGRPDDGPFDGIVVTAAAPHVPPALPSQLAPNGRLVVPVGRRDQQELLLIVRQADGFRQFDCGSCVFVPLVGEGGFREEAPPQFLGRVL